MLGLSLDRPDAWRHLRDFLVDGYVLHKVEAEVLAANVYRSFDNLIAYCNSNDAWPRDFNLAGAEWKLSQRQAGHRNSGFFAPYFRDGNQQKGADMKVVFQSCPSFWNSYGPPEKPAELSALDGLLAQCIDLARPIMSEYIRHLIALEPSLITSLLGRDGQPCLSVRVIRYTPDSLAATNPHFDKSALTCILHTTDLPGQEELVFASPWKQALTLSDFRPARRKNSDDNERKAIIFPGQAFEASGFDFLAPTPHAVLPFSGQGYRYSIVIFWLMEGADLGAFETAVSVLDGGRVLRAYEKSAQPAL